MISLNTKHQHRQHSTKHPQPEDTQLRTTFDESPLPILQLQRLIGNRAVQRLLAQRESQPLVQRDLKREPPGRTGDYTPLTPDEVTEAIDFNSARINKADHVRTIQDIVGAEQTGTFDEPSIHMLSEWQADFRLDVDGKIGKRTLKPIVQEVIAIGEHNLAIKLVLDGHDLYQSGLKSIRYDSSLTDNNAVTSGPIPGDSTVRIGRPGFERGYNALVHTIAHEMEHVRQNKAGIADIPLSEFLGERIEILSRGMLEEGITGFMSDAERALTNWNAMTTADQKTHWSKFEEVREKVKKRFDALSTAAKTTHQTLMDNYNAVTKPA